MPGFRILSLIKMRTYIKKVFLTVLMLFQLLSNGLHAQFCQRVFTRGADTAEIYLRCQWYADENYITWNAIFHSNNNGQSLSVNRKINWMIEGGNIYGDSTPGVLYQIPFRCADSFAVSHDYGKTFEPKYFSGFSREAAGCMEGELYISGYGLFRGTDFGNIFTMQSNDNTYYLQDVGVNPGELFMIKGVIGLNPMTLGYINDYGQTFINREILLPGMPSILNDISVHRGTLPGELYIVAWNWVDTIALFHSFDYGQTVTLQSFMLQTTDEVLYTPGRAPGAFYYARREICGTPPFLHSCLWIYFSRDYGVTFTTYFHDLDSVYTGINYSEIQPQLNVFPNPPDDHLNFKFYEEMSNCDINISLFDLTGKQVAYCILRKGKREICMDVRNLPVGLYYYRLFFTKSAQSNLKQQGLSIYNYYGKVQIFR